MIFPFISSTVAPDHIEGPVYWFIIRHYHLLVEDHGVQVKIPQFDHPDSVGLEMLGQQYLGILEHPNGPIHCFSAEVEESSSAPEGFEFLSLRRLFGRLEESLLGLAGRAIQIVEWDRTHQFCGRCGVPVEDMIYERAKKCPECGLTTYPRISPAVIVRVERQLDGQKEILLARNIRNPRGFYSVLAGFVEPGESLEECVRREIREEVGIEVRNIRYFGSQPWPFPHSLMIAFTADYAGGEIKLEEEEIAEANWYRPDALPNVPPSISIARQLIDNFVKNNGV